MACSNAPFEAGRLARFSPTIACQVTLLPEYLASYLCRRPASPETPVVQVYRVPPSFRARKEHCERI
eukprot:1900517-Rhodomonas_salina.1